MKNNFFSGIKDKILNVVEVSDEDEEFYEDEIDEYDVEDDYEDKSTNDYGSQVNYDFGYSSNSSSFGKTYEPQEQKSSFESKYTQKQNSNIYQMNSNAKAPSKVTRVVYFYLEEPDDARNIADCMIAQDAVVLLDMSKLTKDESLCVLYFLDGVRYIYKSKTEMIIDNIYLIVPQSIELSGDFYEQVSQGAFF
ncbi:MAG: cell division protein SepF [Faecalibacterium sp.]|nr:cell division protein SepF [Ruminococcus sp.]MCM1391751.1 cell division protein SepF [Ruminococcus sp.]MCM1485031.1 cell division protein SepF [Faecalibacterium sp.]